MALLIKVYFIYVNGLNDEYALDGSAGGVFISLTIEEGECIIQTIVITREHWYVQEPHEFTARNVQYVGDMESFREVMSTKGKPTETLKAENIELHSIY